MLTIIGGGFGLYGYLPAIFFLKKYKVVLWQRYQKILEKRKELRLFLERIIWVPTIEEALSISTIAVIAVPPKIQEEYIYEIQKYPNIKRLIIEKPIAHEPQTAMDLLDQLIDTKKKFRIGYNFFYTKWYTQLKEHILDRTFPKIEITWKFCADHFKRNKETWKKYHSQGGGVLRFYGIHLLAVLAEHGYVRSIKSNLIVGREIDQPAEWDAIFEGGDLPKIKIQVSSHSNENLFLVKGIKKESELLIYSSLSPFSDVNEYQDQDIRVKILEAVVSSLDDDDRKYFLRYKKTNELWKASELLSSKLENKIS